MSGFDALIDQATRGLAPDPELRLEVAHELRTHLLASAAEHRAAGESESNAAARAAEEFGDAGALADQLLSANRARMRTRRLTRWAAAVTLAPASAAIAINVAWTSITSALVLLALVAGAGGWPVPLNSAMHAAVQRVWNATLARLAPADREIVNADSGDIAARQANARALVDRFPDNPVYFAHYANTMLQGLRIDDLSKQIDQLNAAIIVLDRGATLDPHNALYPLTKAGLLLALGSREQWDVPQETLPGISLMNARGKPIRFTLPPIQVTDQAAFERGLAALHEAAQKQFFDSRVSEFERQRLDLLPSPRFLSDGITRISVQMSTPLSYLNPERQAIARSADYAVLLARRGDANQIDSIMRDQEAIVRLAGRDARYRVDLLVATGLRSLMLTANGLAGQTLDRPEQLGSARVGLEALLRLQNELFGHRVDESAARLECDSLLGSAILKNSILTIDPSMQASARVSEYSVIDQLAVSCLAALLLLAVLESLVLAPFRRKNVFRAFIGWHRLLWVALGGAVAPLAIYLIFAYATPLGARAFGLGASSDRLMVEYCALFAIICVATRALADLALRQRALELGLAAPSERNPARGRFIRPLELGIGLVLVAAVVAYLTLWRPRFSFAATWLDLLHTAEFWTWVLCIALMAYGLWWLLLRHQGTAHSLSRLIPPPGARRALGRPVSSAAVCLCLCAVMLASILPVALGKSRDLRTEPLLLSIFFACAGVLLLLGFMRLIDPGPALGAAARDDHTPIAPSRLWLVYAACALLVLAAGIPFLRWEERKSVAATVEQMQPLFQTDDVQRLQPLRAELVR